MYVKVNLSLCKPQRTMRSGESCSSSALLGVEPLASRPGCFICGERATVINWIGGDWVAEEVWTLRRRGKTPFHLPGFEPRFHGRKAISYPELQEDMCRWRTGVDEKKVILAYVHLRSYKYKVHSIISNEGTDGEQKYSSTLSFTSVLDGMGCLTPLLGRFTLGNGPVPHCKGDCVGPSAGMDGGAKSRPHQDPIPGPSSP